MPMSSKFYIVSGGGIEFMRPWTEEAYDIPPEEVVGSSVGTQFVAGDPPSIVRYVPEPAKTGPFGRLTKATDSEPTSEVPFVDGQCG